MSCSQLHALGEATGTLLDREAYRRATAELVRVGSHLLRMIVALGAKKASGGAHKVPREQGFGGQRGVGGGGAMRRLRPFCRSLTKKIVQIVADRLKVYSRGVHHFLIFFK